METDHIVRNMVKLIEELSEIPTDRNVVIDFFADWCGPCKMIAPKFNELESQFSSVTFLKANVDDAQELAERFSVRAMPTFIFMKKGKVVKLVEGADLKNIIAMLEALEDN
jgi:thioredoxin 1